MEDPACDDPVLLLLRLPFPVLLLLLLPAAPREDGDRANEEDARGVDEVEEAEAAVFLADLCLVVRLCVLPASCAVPLPSAVVALLAEECPLTDLLGFKRVLPAAASPCPSPSRDCCSIAASASCCKSRACIVNWAYPAVANAVLACPSVVAAVPVKADGSIELESC